MKAKQRQFLINKKLDVLSPVALHYKKRWNNFFKLKEFEIIQVDTVNNGQVT